MSSAECFRELVNERLMLAADEIFGVFKNIIFEYDEEMHRQRTLLDVLLKPVIKLRRTEVPEQRVCAEEEVADSPQIKVELQESCPGQEGPQLVTEAHSETIIMTPARTRKEKGGNGHSGDMGRWFTPDVRQSEAEPPASFCFSMIKTEADQENSGVREPRSDAQLPRNSHHIAESSTPTGDGEYWESEPPQVVEGLCVGQEDKQSVQEQGDDNMTSTCDDSKEETVCTRPDKTSSAGEKESVVNVPVKSSVAREPKNDHNLQSNEKKRSHGRAFRSRINAALKQKKEHRKSHSESKCESPVLSIQHNIENDQQVFKCAECPKHYKCKPSLLHHMKIHGTEWPFSCEICGKGFLEVSKLIKHMKAHTKKRPHICHACNKGFFTYSELKRHMLSHTDERPFACKTCGKGFKRSSHLIRHQKIHKACVGADSS